MPPSNSLSSLVPPSSMLLAKPNTIEAVAFPTDVTGVAVECDGSITIAISGHGYRARFDNPARISKLGALLLVIGDDLDKAQSKATAALDRIVAGGYDA